MRMVSFAECDPDAERLQPSRPWEPFEQAGVVGRTHRGGAYEQVVLWPRPSLVVQGERELVEPLLTGARVVGRLCYPRCS